MRLRLGLWRALPALVVWLGAGCEALVDGQLGAVRCQDQGVIGPPACPDGLACRSGQCVPNVLGAVCAFDTDCAYGELCLDPEALGGVGPERCTRTCCTASDCDPQADAVCWIPPAGGGAFCRPAVEVDRAPGGMGSPLAACATGADCRSGRCVDRLCQDTCCTDTPCTGGGGTCRVEGPPIGDAVGFWCAPAEGPELARYQDCTTDADCASGLCLDFLGKSPQCSAPCCSSSDCEDLDGAPVRCVILGGAHSGVRACLTESAAGAAAVGATCDPATPSQCRGGMCLSLPGRDQCSDICCSDAACGSSAVCRPAMIAGAWALQCEPK
jgi:hypothetical protein